MNEKLSIEILDIQAYFDQNPKEQLETHTRMDDYKILVITSGKGVHMIDFESFSYKAGDILLITKNQVHRYVVNRNVKGYIIKFKGDAVNILSIHEQIHMLEVLRRGERTPLLRGTCNILENIHEICAMMLNVNDTYDESGKLDILKHYLYITILMMRDCLGKEMKHINIETLKTYNAFKELVERHYANKKSVSDYAKMLNVSEKALNKIVIQATDMNVRQFVNKRIVLEIERYLSYGNLSAAEIAALLGFTDSSNMARFFKRYVGMTPLQFRKSVCEIA